MTNKELARCLRETAALMQLAGEDAFKAKAYETAAFRVRGWSEPLSDAVLAGQWPDIPGIGKSLQTAVQDLVRTGSFAKLDALRQAVPAGVQELARVPGLGPTKVMTLWKTANLTDLDSVRTAAESGELAKLKGFGEKTQAQVYNALLYYQSNRGKLHLSTAWNLGNELTAALLAQGILAKVVGQTARNLPVVDQLELVAQTDAVEPLQMALAKAGCESTLSGDVLQANTGEYVVHVHMAPNQRWVAECLRRTHWGEHLQVLEAALAHPLDSEEEAYARAGKLWLPAELGENRGEFDRAHRTPPESLLQEGHLQGSLHTHSTWSDGVHSLREMAEACRQRGWSYLGITDHSQSAFYANGLNVTRLQDQWAEIDALNAEWKDFHIFKGIESDILADGRLDYPDDVLAGFDFVVASVHSNLRMDAATATQRLVRAIENPYTHILGHPTGRLLLNREGYPIDHQRVIDACKANGVAIELNSNPWRLDLDWTWLDVALQAGVLTAICPDAHSTEGLDDVQWGVRVGRKAWLTPEQTLNAWPAERLSAWFSSKKP